MRLCSDIVGRLWHHMHGTQICEALEERGLEARETGEGEPWVVVSHLRDHVLLPGERRRIALWMQVRGIVPTKFLNVCHYCCALSILLHG